jgi:hypothetical protein
LAFITPRPRRLIIHRRRGFLLVKIKAFFATIEGLYHLSLSAEDIMIKPAKNVPQIIFIFSIVFS